MTTSTKPKAKDIMSRKLKVLHPKETIQSAKEIYDTYDIHHIPVAVMGRIKGIISMGDLLNLFHKTPDFITTGFESELLYDLSVDQVMTYNPICVNDDLPLSDVIDTMISKHINCVLVTQEELLVGIITSHDILKFLKSNL